MSSLTRTKPGQKLYFWRKNVIICLCQTLREPTPRFHFAFSAEYILVVAIDAAIVAAIDAAIMKSTGKAASIAAIVASIIGT